MEKLLKDKWFWVGVAIGVIILLLWNRKRTEKISKAPSKTPLTKEEKDVAQHLTQYGM